MKKIKTALVYAIIIVSVLSLVSISVLGNEPWDAILNRHPLNKRVVDIGVIYSSPASYNVYSPLLEKASSHINEYCDKLGYEVEFNFIEEDAGEDAVVHQQKVEMFHDMEVNLLIAGCWSSQASYSLDYVNENNMIMFSPSSTYYELAVVGDNLYRLTPDDNYQAKAMAEMLASRGVDSIVVLQLGIGWGYGLSESLEEEFALRGGYTHPVIVYPEEARGKIDYDFTPYLDEAESAALALVDAGDEVGFVVISFGEVAGIINQVYYHPSSYPTLDGLTWYGPDGVARATSTENNAWDGAAKYEMYSTLAAPTRSEKWYSLADELGYEPTFYPGCLYDICWIYAKAILEASTSETEGVKSILEDVSTQYYGVTGWCNLNDAGDRHPLDYDVWKFDGTDGWVLAGRWDKYTEVIYWN
jgi:branched-chain amino acid transport system substrate-binding protein